MDSVTNYWLLWSVYLLASAAFFAAFWPLTRFPRVLWLSYLLRAVTIALVFTPWYANQQSSVLAPALMVVALDAITIGSSAVVRSIVPLFLSLMLALIIAGIWYLIARRRLGNNHKKQDVIEDNS